jgi:3'-5' exonuclease
MQGYEKMNTIVLDIETLSSGQPDFENLKTEEQFLEEAPKSYSKPKQQEWATDKFNNQLKERDEEFRKKALDSLQGRLFCIGICYNDEPVDIIKFNMSEREMMIELTEWIETNVGQRNIPITKFIGHRIGAFDLLWLIHRAYKYGNKKLLGYLPIGKFDKRVVDTNDLFNNYTYGKYTSLDNICKFFEIEGKTEGMDGSKVWDYYLANKYDEIYSYCCDDVEATRRIYKMMTI